MTSRAACRENERLRIVTAIESNEERIYKFLPRSYKLRVTPAMEVAHQIVKHLDELVKLSNRTKIAA